MAVICQRVVILLQLCTDMIDITLILYFVSNLSHLEHIQYCYKAINAKEELLAVWQFGIRIFGVPLEKSCKSVVSPYIFTVIISFLIVDTLRVQKKT